MEQSTSPNLTQVNYCDLFNKPDHQVCWFVHYDATFYWKVVSMVFITTVGLTGNFLLAFTILQSKRLRSKSINIFIVNLSFSNFLNLLLSAPSVLVDSITEFFVLQEIGCKSMRVVQTVFFLVPMLTLLVISVDRYLVIKYPFRDLKYNRKAFLICAVIWFIGIGMSIPQYTTKVFDSQEFKDITVDNCYDKWTIEAYWTDERIYRFSILTVVFIFPFTGLFVFYAGILIRIKRVARQIGIQDEVHNNNVFNVAMMVILVIITTGACWLPMTIYWIIKYLPQTYQGPLFHERGKEPMTNLHYLGQTFIFVHSALQPVIYFLTGTKLRNELGRMISFRRRGSSPGNWFAAGLEGEKGQAVNLERKKEEYLASQDEGFSSAKEDYASGEEDSCQETEMDEKNDPKQIVISITKSDSTKQKNKPEEAMVATAVSVEVSGEKKNVLEIKKTPRRKGSFYLDFDPMSTPPDSPKARK